MTQARQTFVRLPKKRYVIQVATHATPPNEPWADLRFEGGRLYHYFTPEEADAMIVHLQKAQRHVTFGVKVLPE